MTDAQTPSEAGSDLQDPETMTDTQDAARPVAQAINGFAEMSMERTGGCNYSVYSWRTGENTVHRVNTAGLSCTCPDMQWNRDGDHDVCDHVAYAVFHAPKDRDIGEEAFGNIVGMLTEMNDYKNALEQRRGQLDGTADVSPASDDSSDEKGNSAVSVGSAKELLTETLGELDGLYLKNDGRVGSETYEGTDQVTFKLGGDDFSEVKRVTSKCDLVGYNGEENTLAITDVQEYVEEVL